MWQPRTALSTALLALSSVALAQEAPLALTGARLIDGSGAAPIENAVLLIQDGRVLAAGAADAVSVPAEAQRIELSGRTLMPGIINAHGHAGDDPESVLARYARQGVTTVVSLGGEGEEHLALRAAQSEGPLTRSRLFVAGPVANPDSAEQARRDVDALADMGVDWVKIRVNDGSMPADAYQALNARAAEQGLKVAAHMLTLADAKGLLRAGTDLLAHSVRDQEIDEEFVTLMREADICLTPTLTRELSTFAYAQTPEWFADPFFQRHADPQAVENLQTPEARQRYARGQESGQAMLTMAQTNLRLMHDAGLRIALGTDSGFADRFIGYFEHLEMELMAEAGVPAMDILVAATGEAAACVGLQELGTLTPGKHADFLVLRDNPLDDIRNSKSLEAVWIGGAPLPDTP